MDQNGRQVGGVIINAYTEIFNRQLQEIKMEEPGFGNYRDNEVIRVANSSIFGLVTAWSSNTKTLYARDWNGTVKEGDVIIGDETNSSWTVDNLNGTYVKLYTSQTVQSPLTAAANDDYGFTTTITEFPDA